MRSIFFWTLLLVAAVGSMLSFEWEPRAYIQVATGAALGAGIVGLIGAISGGRGSDR